LKFFSLAVTAEALRAKIDRKRRICSNCVSSTPEFSYSDTRDRPHQSFCTDSYVSERFKTLSLTVFHSIPFYLFESGINP